MPYTVFLIAVLVAIVMAGCTTTRKTEGVIDTDALQCIGWCAHVLHGVTVETTESTDAEEVKRVVKEQAKKEVKDGQ